MPGRIVFASEFWFGSTGAGLAHGFRQLGWDVGEVDMRDHLLKGRTHILRLAARALRRECVASYNKALLEAVDTLRPEAFVTVKGAFLTPVTLARIRERGVMTINYYPDYHFDFDALDPETFAHYDLFFTTKSFQLEHLRALLGAERVRFLHHGYSALVHRPHMAQVTDDDYIADVLYVGNHSPYKEQWLSAVARDLPEVDLKIVGSGWKGAASLTHSSTGHALVGDSYARVLQRARINLAVHSGPAGPHEWEDLVSTRTFEIPACKGFMLHIDNEEVRDLFEPGVEIDVFADLESLTKKIVFYLESSQQRSQMIERAFARCVPLYSYECRAQELADVIAVRQTASRVSAT